ncbi:unnamed protein product, partial [Haemonchus placei]|uniref:DNA-directed RNA polymerase n=1 Tax=Haemonchus placei TaxID=6290 RepID=A0A0N4VXW9_HAEPC
MRIDQTKTQSVEKTWADESQINIDGIPQADLVLRLRQAFHKHGQRYEGESSETLRPWCVAGKISTRCYCAGENCFRDTWSVFVFLLEVYREGFSNKMKGQSKKLAKSYGKLKQIDQVTTGSGHSVASTLYCILREMKKEFKLG